MIDIYTIDGLIRKLENLRYESEYHTSIPIISKKHFPQVEQMIRQFFIDNHDAELGNLRAKVYVYEKIIANSNFAPILPQESE